MLSPGEKKPAKAGLVCCCVVIIPTQALSSSENLSQPSFASCLCEPVALYWAVNVMDCCVVPVNLRHRARFYSGAMEHALRHKMSKALYRGVPAKAPERFSMMRYHVDRGANSL
ncbi:hypothetical protein LU631_02775 [Erwinia tracheiphila]|nr:hypothetical protein [Erwinia tracheiphila]UIA88372.1 hypothetical protein LU631_02775 [Erwinia tracheiphila]UIA96207.1 hypothetical protein LU633_23385 [Erwinia tracheiphila]